MLRGFGNDAQADGYADTVLDAIPPNGAANPSSTLTTDAGPARGIVALRERPEAKERDSAIECLPPSLRERYDDLCLLGEGGMGTVYRGRDRRLGRTVALKLLRRADPVLALRLLQEARAQARVQHEQVCRVYEAGEADGEPFITMQYIEGEPLDKAKGRMTLEQKVKVMVEVSAALHEAHRLGLVHRDIKPGNILVETGEDGVFKPYVVDFGLARDVSEHGQTMTGAVLGTPAFMAPEQARGEVRSLDRRTDVYSLGATLYDLLAGRPPFVAEHPWKVLAMVADEEAPALYTVMKQVPGDLETIVMKCLQREPSQRYESARALGDDLQRFLDGDPIQARRAALGYVLWRKARKHWLALLLAGAAALAAAAPAGAWVHARQQAAEQVVVARELGEDIKEMELFLRGAYTLPLHDVEKERDVVRARLGEIERRMTAAGKVGEGPGHYALGRGYLALGEPQKAREHLEKALAGGYSSVELRYALGQALGELYKVALEETKRIQNQQAREAKVHEIEATLRDPALAHLGVAVGAAIESPAYAEGLIAFYGGNYDEALAKAKEAFDKASWLYEAKKLEGDVHYALGSRYRHDAEFDWDKMMAHFDPAADAYRAAAEMARSDPEVHRVECELWTHTMMSAAAMGQPARPTFDKAKEACARAIAASSKDGRARTQRAFAHVMFMAGEVQFSPSDGARKLLDEAIALAQDAVSASPQDPMARYILGEAFGADAGYRADCGQDDRASSQRAIAALDATLGMDPQFVWALNGLLTVSSIRVMVDARQGLDVTETMEAAAQQMKRAMTLDPDYPFPWINMANIHNFVASAVVERGRPPQEQFQRILDAAEALKQRASGHQSAHYANCMAYGTMALYEIEAGQDPHGSLAQAAQHIEELKQHAVGIKVDDVVGELRYLEALHLLRQRQDPEPALREAREAWRRVREQSPWNIYYAVSHARVEVVAVRWAMEQRRAQPAMFDAAFAPLRPFLSEERYDPALYQTLAEIHALRAAWLLQRGKSPAEDIAEGLAMAGKALAINPRMAKAFAAKAHIHLVEARAAQDRSIRAEAASRAEEAFKDAFRNNPLLEQEHAAALKDAARMR